MIVGVLIALAWAVPSIGASTAKIARKAFARANLAYYHASLAIDTSNKANATASTASATANSAKVAAGQAQTTANQALSLANGAVQREDNFTMTFDPTSISGASCTSSPFSRLGVLSSDEVIVTPPDTQPIGILTQAFTSNGQVTLEICNATGAPIDPPSGTYEFSILR